MIGTPVTYLPKFSQGLVGYIVVADTDKMYLDSIEFIQVGIEDDSSSLQKISEAVELDELNDNLSNTEAPDIAFSFESGLIYLFLKNSVFPYLSTSKFVVLGKRSGLPILSLNDSIDVPEKHLELYVKYAIKESAQLLGKLVPPSIEKDIKELENKLR